MKYTALILSILFLASFSAAQNVVEVEATLGEGNDFRYYADDGKVGYVAMWSTERTEDGVEREATWENMSIERWTAMKTNSMGEKKVKKELISEFGEEARNISTSVTQGDDFQHFAIEVTYNINFNYSFSYEEFEEAVPDNVEATLNYKDRSDTATMPVVPQKDNRTIHFGQEELGDFGASNTARQSKQGEDTQEQRDGSDMEEESEDSSKEGTMETQDEEGGLLDMILGLLPF